MTRFIPDSLPGQLRIVGGLALIALLAGLFVNRQEFFRAYLSAYLFILAHPLGSLAILMLHHLVGGRWGFMTQRLLEAAVGTLPLAALLFVPLAAGMEELYLWARPEAAVDPTLREKAAYLNAPFFWARAATYFAVWLALGQLLRRWSLAQDRTADARFTERLQSLSGPGLVLYGLTVSFSAIDWAMSLEPHWYSTIYGLIFVLNHGLAALALVICAAAFLAQRGALGEIAGADRFHDLGNFLLALVMLWAYLNFSQYMIIWVENLHEEIPWVLRRTTGGWEIIAAALLAGQFALPFVLLLARANKRNCRILAAVALSILLMQWVHAQWLITPAFHPQRFYIHWLDFAALIGMGAVWLAAFLSRLEERALLPLHDPRFAGEIQQAQRA